MKQLLFVAILAVMSFGLAPQVFSQSYNIYFGDFHAHTWYSDGNQDKTMATWTQPVARAIAYADSSPSMNWLGISDHNHNEGGLHMTLNYWRAGNHEADSVNQDGVFVGMRGQEWGVISGGGHVVVYGTDKLFGWDAGVYDVYVPKSNYTLLFDSVYKYGGFCYLAHPQQTDFGGIFTNPYNAQEDSVVKGVAMRSGPATSTNTSETDPSTTDYNQRFWDLLKLGYHVAPCAHQDNHNTTFGRANQQRTAVLATTLTRANVLDALKSRRVYATMDHNLQLRFTDGAHQMGEIFSISDSVRLSVSATDPDGEQISTIQIWYGVPGSGSNPTVLATASNAGTLNFSRLQATNSTYYYYAKVTEADGQMAWSAPMWITITTGSAPAAFNLSSPANTSTSQPISGTLNWAASTYATQYDVYLGTTNPPTTVVSSNQSGTSYNYAGLSNNQTYYWKVTAKNTLGSLDATSSPWSFTTVLPSPGTFAVVSPTSGSTSQALSGTLKWRTSSFATGYDVYLGTANPPTTVVSTSQTDTSYSYSSLAAGTTYYWKVIAKNTVGNTTGTSAPWNFATVVMPSAFSLLTPASGTTGSLLNGTLTWQTSTNATGYDVYLDSNNPPVIIVSTNQSGTSYNFSGLVNNTQYYWKVIAKNSVGTVTSTSSPWNFTTILKAPAAFAVVSPASGATNQLYSGTLLWRSSLNAVTYDVYFGTANPPTTKVSTDQTDTSYSFSGLTPGMTYYWKVSAKDSSVVTDGTNSPWSFTTINLPAAFALSLPANGGHEVPISGSLSWNASTYAATYDVYFDTLNPPVSIVSADQGTTTYSYSGLILKKLYYWKVVAKNTGGSTVSNTAPWSFISAGIIPGTFTHVTPIDGASDQNLSGVIKWQQSVNATAYDVYLDANNPPTTLVSSNQTDTAFSYSGLSANGSYYWSVIAKSITDSATGAGAPWHFTTYKVPTTFSLVSPANASSGVSLSGFVTWDSSANATSYDVYFDQNNPPTTPVAISTTNLSFEFTSLLSNKTYYWSVIAKNLNGTIVASNGPFHFTSANLPPAISSLSPGTRASHSLMLLWTDTISNETGFHVYRATNLEGPFDQVGGDLPMNSSSYTDTGLVANKSYYYEVTGFNASGEGNPVMTNAITLCDIPGAPSMANLKYSSFSAIINPGANSPSSQYEIQVTDSSGAFFLQANGTLDTIPVWQTSDQWGGATGTAVLGVLACQSYQVQVRARNDAQEATGFGTALAVSVPCFQVAHAVLTGWNLISVPINETNFSRTAIFPSSVSDAYAYDKGYTQQGSLAMGSGYWLKFSGDTTYNHVGVPVFTDTIDVKKGWNIIGSVSASAPVAGIVSLPGGLVTSQFFGYTGSYTNATSIDPGKGYWVKVQNDGQLILSSTAPALAGKIVILPLSELPPPPPGVMDDKQELPTTYSLSQNYPNPFNPSTVIRYSLPANSNVSLKVYDILGREVATLIDGMQDAGFKSVRFDATNFPSGMYYYRLITANYSSTKRMMLMK